jgi:hypothetical protein
MSTTEEFQIIEGKGGKKKRRKRERKRGKKREVQGGSFPCANTLCFPWSTCTTVI